MQQPALHAHPVLRYAGRIGDMTHYIIDSMQDAGVKAAGEVCLRMTGEEEPPLFGIAAA
jgi:hypothetical protein